MAPQLATRSGLRTFLTRRRQLLLDALAAISFANLCFVDIWAQLLDQSSVAFFHKPLFGRQLLGITTANILAIAAVLFAAISISRRLSQKPRGVAEVAFLAILLIPFNVARTKVFSIELSFLKSAVYAPILLIAVAVAMWQRKRLIFLLRHALIIAFPIFPICALQVWAAYNRPLDPSLTGRPPAPLLHAGQPRPVRAVWVIFDELDYCLAFPSRSPKVSLPELDRLQATSMHTEKATSPGPNTIQAIPGLVTGRPVEKAFPNEAGDLRVLYAAEKNYRLLTKQNNVFAKAHEQGLNAGVDGWFLPYCRLFPLAQCQWEPVTSVFLRENYGSYVSFGKAMAHQVESKLGSVPGLRVAHLSAGELAWANLPQSRRASRERSMMEYQRIHAAAMKLLDDPNLDLVYLHWPTPHPLSYYDRRSAAFTSADGTNYFDALALVDRTLGDIRKELERTGRWKDTVLLVSGDHPLRANVLREAGLWTKEEQASMGDSLCSYVPFLLKLPGEETAAVYQKSFNTAVSGDLLLAVLRQQVAAPEDAARWLDAHAGAEQQPN